MSLLKNKNSGNTHSGAFTSDNEPFFKPQAKLKVGEANDKYENEADAIADKVVNQRDIFGNEPFFKPAPKLYGSKGVQKQEEAEQIQKKPIRESITPLVQRKQEDEEPVQTKQGEEPVQMKEEESDVQRQEVESGSGIEEETVQKKEEDETIQSKQNGNEGDTSQLESQLMSSKGGGRPMDNPTKDQMESGFGADFSDVKIHTNSNAVQMNQNLGAKAFANENDIYFNEGNYNPTSKEGQHLLAHELTHTIQQGGGKSVAQTKDNIQLSPLSDELSQLWTSQGKGVFYERLRQVSPLSDPDIIPFVMTLRGDDLWLTQNIITHGRESGWPIHLKVQREMKGWGDSGGKGAVFDLLRTANGSEAANANLSASLTSIFGVGTQDIWLARLLQQHGIEANWPFKLRIQRDLKGWADSGGFAAVVTTIRAATVNERQTAVADSEVLAMVRTSLAQAEGTAVISELLVGSQNWDNPPATDFYAHFVTNRGNGAIPSNRTMNCWESILYSAHLAGHVSADWIHNYYISAGAVPNTQTDPTPRLWAQLGFSTALPTYDPAAGRVPSLGQLVFYLPTGASIPSHVAVANGSNEVISLWTRPNNISSVQRIPIDSISGTIYYGNPPW